MTIHHSGDKQSEPTEAIFCIGSNCGDREGNVMAALEWLSGLFIDLKYSSIYATPDCHGGKRVYMNAVAAGHSSLSASQLTSLCKEFEISHGRDSSARASGDVPVDVDIVVFGGKILRERDFCSDFFLIGYMQLADAC